MDYKMFNSLAQRLANKLPNLGKDLTDADIHEGPIEYLSKTIGRSSFIALALFIVIASTVALGAALVAVTRLRAADVLREH